MPVVDTDVLVKFSTKAGTAGNQNAQPDPNASLGKYISTTQITSNSLHNLFDIITGTENTNLTTDFRCIFIHNAHASIAMENVGAYISSQVAGGADITISVDTTAASTIGSATAQAKEIANETTAPAGQTFSAPATAGTALAMGTIAAGQCKAIWVRRAATNSAALSGDNVVLAVRWDSL